MKGRSLFVVLTYLLHKGQVDAMESKLLPLKGIIPPLITPLRSQDEIDFEATQRLIEHVIEGGCSGLFLLGSTGEGPSLSLALREDFIRYCCDIVDRRVPVLVSISDTALVELLRMSDVSKKAGADAVVLTVPYYFQLSQNDLIAFIDSVVDQVELPILLYNMPSLTKTWFELETVRKLIAKYPAKIVGMKDSSGDLEYFAKLCSLKQEICSTVNDEEFSVFMGPEHLTLKALELGANGIVAGGANVEPDLFVSLFNAATIAGNEDLTQKERESGAKMILHLMKRLEAFQEIYTVAPWLVATKCACAIRGLCDDLMALPYSKLPTEDRIKIRNILNELPTEFSPEK